MAAGGLMGGALKMIEAPALGQPLDAARIDALGRAAGLRGGDLFRLHDDVAEFDAVWLRIEYRRRARRIEEFNR